MVSFSHKGQMEKDTSQSWDIVYERVVRHSDSDCEFLLNSKSIFSFEFNLGSKQGNRSSKQLHNYNKNKLYIDSWINYFYI